MKIKTIEDMEKLFNEGKLTHFLVSDKCKGINYHAFTYSGIKLKIESFEALYVIFEVDGNRAGYIHFYDIDLKATEKLIKGEKIMTKSDLKDGMVVELRNGDKYVVFLDKIMNISRYIAIYQYDDNLEADINIFDIVKIFKSEGWTLKNIFDDDNLTLIWKRKEKSKAEIKPDIIEKQIEELQKSAKDLREELKGK